MDPLAVGYRVMGEEMQREQAGYTTDPLSSAAGDARQYAIVDLDTSPVGTKAVGVELQIAGDTRWYSNDFGNGAGFYTGGHARTAVKLPLDWHGKAITGRASASTPRPPHRRRRPRSPSTRSGCSRSRAPTSTAYRRRCPHPRWWSTRSPTSPRGCVRCTRPSRGRRRRRARRARAGSAARRRCRAASATRVG